MMTEEMTREALVASIMGMTPPPVERTSPPPKKDWKVDPASASQINYIHSLAATRGSGATQMLAGVDYSALTKGAASALIDALKALPVVTSTASFKFAVPEGEYALRTDEGIKFYTVSEGKGKWAGMQFVSVHASDERYSLKGESRKSVLAQIAADPKAAAVLYGIETNHCFRCGKELTDEASRAAGIGPVCAKKSGW